ncbi:hypothetical protein [Paenibacillus apiarius]|uniref:hypothetical protein n=1 Tax=Paenibacillus apiarius TaxID=46240 RepID=UPI003B3B4F56
MKRRLNFACAISHSPKLLIMDEPTVGIDPQSRNHILESVLHCGVEDEAAPRQYRLLSMNHRRTSSIAINRDVGGSSFVWQYESFFYSISAA